MDQTCKSRWNFNVVGWLKKSGTLTSEGRLSFRLSRMKCLFTFFLPLYFLSISELNFKWKHLSGRIFSLSLSSRHHNRIAKAHRAASSNKTKDDWVLVVVVVTDTRTDNHLSEVVYFVEVAGLPHLVLLVLVNEGTIFWGITFYVVGLLGLFNSSRFRIILYLILIRKGLPLIPLTWPREVTSVALRKKGLSSFISSYTSAQINTETNIC